MEGHTEIEQVLRLGILWDCVQHKVVTTFQRFGITSRSSPAFKGQDVPVEHVLLAYSLHTLDVC